MSSLTTNTARGARRAQIVAEAVVSAYINEITATERPRERARARADAPASQGCAEPSPAAISRRSPLASRSRGRPFAARRPAAALEVGC